VLTFAQVDTTYGSAGLENFQSVIWTIHAAILAASGLPAQKFCAAGEYVKISFDKSGFIGTLGTIMIEIAVESPSKTGREFGKGAAFFDVFPGGSIAELNGGNSTSERSPRAGSKSNNEHKRLLAAKNRKKYGEHSNEINGIFEPNEGIKMGGWVMEILKFLREKVGFQKGLRTGRSTCGGTSVKKTTRVAKIGLAEKIQLWRVRAWEPFHGRLGFILLILTPSDNRWAIKCKT
jgi:hypothetical protein